MGTLKRVAPILPVRDLRAALGYYRQLGFPTREYDSGEYKFRRLLGYCRCEGPVGNVDRPVAVKAPFGSVH